MQIKIIRAMSKSKHLTTFTSIITLLKVKNPQLAQQLDCLRFAIIQWYEGVEQQMLIKNKAIISARTKGTQKLAVFLNQVQNYFRNLIRNYSDPNLPIYFKLFHKIKEQFEFIDIDFSKFVDKQREKQTQTDKQIIGHFGIDMQKMMHNLQNKQNQLQKLQHQIVEISDQNFRLANHIFKLEQQMKNDELLHFNKVKHLQQLLQKLKADPSIPPMSPTQKKNNPVYRSNPQIHTYDGITNKKLWVNLLSNGFQDVQIHNSITQSNPSVKRQDKKQVNDNQLRRFLFNQAVVIQNFLLSAEAYQRQRDHSE